MSSLPRLFEVFTKYNLHSILRELRVDENLFVISVLGLLDHRGLSAKYFLVGNNPASTKLFPHRCSHECLRSPSMAYVKISMSIGSGLSKEYADQNHTRFSASSTTEWTTFWTSARNSTAEGFVLILY